VENIVSLILTKGLKIRFGLMGVRVDTLNRMDDSLLGALHRAGCINLDVGVESGSDRVLSSIQKGITVADVLRANERIRRFPFNVKYTFIIGWPGEKDTEIRETLKLAQRLSAANKGAYTPFYVATPYPGTQLSQEAEKFGYKPPGKLEDWRTFNRDTWYLNNPCWLSKKLMSKLKMITFVSFLCNRNVTFKITDRIYKILFYIYYPIARLRLVASLYGLPLELRLEKLLNRLVDI
ncbi:MAG: radical SAM protein, partial [Dehalococcoidia bacterium]